ncbi:YvrJ family protein [Halobacillus sp. A5]|nr:YvrJ family protein [Halobacillus sp. A5]MCP3026304.1 YvrJ family protein [Halobacillus sp. A5]
MEVWLPIVTDLGFPIAVTFYLLHRIEGKLDVLIDTLHQFSNRS